MERRIRDLENSMNLLQGMFLVNVAHKWSHAPSSAPPAVQIGKQMMCMASDCWDFAVLSKAPMGCTNHTSSMSPPSLEINPLHDATCLIRLAIFFLAFAKNDSVGSMVCTKGMHTEVGKAF